MSDAAAALRKLAEKAGHPVDPENVASAIPSDEEEFLRQQWLDDRKQHRLHGEACAVCSKDVRVDDEGMLREVTGWTNTPRETVPALVYSPERTGRIVCGACAEGVTGPRQETLL